VSATSQQHRNDRPLLSTAEASKISGLSKVHIQYLARTGRVEGTKPGGHDWMIYEDSLRAFLDQSRSPGRKGPRGPRKKRMERGGRVLLSTAEAQDLTGYARDTLLRFLRSGRIEGEKSGREWLIYEDTLLAYKRRKHPTIVKSEEPPSESEPLGE